MESQNYTNDQYFALLDSILELLEDPELKKNRILRFTIYGIKKEDRWRS